ncbi:hypothetical protein [Eggerthella timonensis]|uniref:hypothetical protein n=1 Tax=Eggerthella timonensis TaxID=1871008 RepID=UPI000C7581EF|nr:hypothetical protein [Eggerthella timonensis]
MENEPMQYQVEMPSLSGGAKFGYGALGFFLMLIGVLVAWLVNKDKAPAVKKSAIVSSVVGMAIGLVAWIAFYAVVFAGVMATYGAYL